MADVVSISPTWIGTASLRHLVSGKTPVLIHRGGTRSGKTYNTAIAAVDYLDQYGAGETLSIVRKTNPALKATVWADVEEVLKKTGRYSASRHNKTDQTFTFPNGAKIDYFSVDKDEKVHGRKRDHLWVNEATELPRDSYDQLRMRTSGKKILDLNPSVGDQHWIYKYYEGSSDAVWYRSTYEDNPHLSAEQVRIIEGFKDTDPYKWAVYGKGERSTPAAAIFPSVHHMEGRWKDRGSVVGIDFGYNHPMAVARVQTRDTVGKPTLEIYALLHESHLTTQDMIDRLPALGVTKQDLIVCDSAEADRIEEIRRAGYNAVKAKKAAGSVKAGIDQMKSHKIVVGGPEVDAFVTDFRQYRWKTNTRTGEVLDAPVKEADDAPDAVRYALTTGLTASRPTHTGIISR